MRASRGREQKHHPLSFFSSSLFFSPGGEEDQHALCVTRVSHPGRDVHCGIVVVEEERTRVRVCETERKFFALSRPSLSPPLLSSFT